MRLATYLPAMCALIVIAGANAHADTIIYEETFEDGVADNITTYFGSFSIAPGLFSSTYGYASANQSGSQQIFGLDGVPSDNVRIEADFRLLNGAVGDFNIGFNITGVSATHQMGQTGYWVGLHPTGSDTPDFIFEHDGGDGLFLVKEPRGSGRFEANEEHHLTIETLCGSINTYIDDVPYMSAPDTTWSGGGIYFGLFGPGTIDNIRVTQLNCVPTPSALAALIGMGLTGLGFGIFRRRKRST